MAAAVRKDERADQRRLPSWMLSALFHVALFTLLIWWVPFSPLRPAIGNGLTGGEIGVIIQGGGDFREPGGGVGANVGLAAVESDEGPSVVRDALSPKNAVPDSPDLPSFAAALPQIESRPGVSPGSAMPSVLPDQKALLKGSGSGRLKGKGDGRGTGSGTGTGAGLGAGNGILGTSFMGVSDNATRVVYVIDASASMSSHNAIGQAKGALIASLNSLDSGQQFQIIFYNEEPKVMSLKNAPKKPLYFATDHNKIEAHQFVQGIPPDGGTVHLLAIMQALKYSPEVMYVLTDSGEPRLSAGELDEIKRRNGSRTHIHCIEFGIGPALRGETGNFLQKLAHDNDGVCRYVDITAAARRTAD